MKKVTIEQLPRVEGNGGIEATIDGNVVTDVKFIINEGPRLVERLVLGRTPEEDVSLAPRICAICSISHKLAAIRAMENTLKVKVPRKVQLLRELTHMGEMIESHSLHTFYLALPDYLGFPNAVAMASKYEFEVKIALEMKNFGNHIMKTLSGRFIHGENPVIGGFGQWPARDELTWIKNRALQFMPFVMKTVDLFCTIDYPDIPEDDTIYACCNPADEKYGFAGEEIILSTGDKIFREDYRNLTNEFVVSHSFCKRSRYNDKPYSVGALARVNNLGERLEKQAGEMFRKYFNRHWKRNPLYNNAAQALEIVYAFERTQEIIDELLAISENPAIVSYENKEGKGTGLVEAPRGLLIHHYRIKDGVVDYADIITPTAQNAEEIERYGLIAAQTLLNKGQGDAIRDRLDILVRAYDPCISCSVHMAEVKKGEENDWQLRLQKLQADEEPLFIGIGNPERSDDGVGIFLADELRKGGKESLLEKELEGREIFSGNSKDQPVIFVDAVDFKAKAGKVSLIPLLSVLHNASLSHKFSPFLCGEMSYAQMKNTYVLGIQPETLEEGKNLSVAVKTAAEKILENITN
ncbi:MAG: hydrogenase maturation protease [Acidobacteriota bacterium]